ncbi:MAG: helix-turn-helix domain-containing protein [Pseudomonadota bacterium]
MDDFYDATYFGNDSATFGDRLHAAREALGLSDKDLARKLGVKLKTVQAWEDDLSEPRANKLQMMAGLLNVSIVWLLNGEGEGPDGAEEQVVLDGDMSELLIELRRTKAEFTRLADHLGHLEKRLQKAAREAV